MVYIKFASVKLILIYTPLIFLIQLFSSETCWAKQKFTIQIAASKNQQFVQDLAKKYDITDSIVMVRSDLWYRYVIGSFDDYDSASAYVKELVSKSKLTNAFIREINFESDISSSTLKNDSIVNPNDSDIEIAIIDSVQQKSETKENSSLAVPTHRKDKSKNQGIGNYIVYLFFNKSEFSVVENFLVDYGNNYIPQGVRGVYLSILKASFQYPIILVFIVIILFFILNIISVFLILNYSIKKKNRKERFLQIYSKMYEGVLLSYLFKEINWESARVKLKRKHRKENRKLLISILLNFHENLKGEVDKFIPEIFTNLGLQKDSLKLANSMFDYRKVQGIRELTYLYSEGALGIISNLINDKNDNVRAEAQTAFIMLNPDDPFKFFQSLTKPFTRWTQLSAFNLLRFLQLPVPVFTNFLYSKHPNIRNFSLRMIIYYQQLENISEIFKMLESKMELTRFLAYRAINDLRLYDGKELIKNKYWIETGKNKLEIIKALRNIGEVEDFDFLKVVIESDLISFKIEACRSMYFMNSESREQLIKLKDNSNIEIDLLIAHVTDPRN